MTCRHSKYDPACSSYQSRLDTLKSDYEKQIVGQTTPDAERYQIEDIEEVGNFLVVKASYPNCRSCAYEGVKVMVFEGVTVKDAIKWKRIDPHFRKALGMPVKTEAPGPIARFPASDQGWKDALAYATARTATRTK